MDYCRRNHCFGKCYTLAFTVWSCFHSLIWKLVFRSKLLLLNYKMTKNNTLYKNFSETAEKNRLENFYLWEKSQVDPFQAKITRKMYPSIFELAGYIDGELNGESDFEIKFLLFECWIIDNSKNLARKHVFWTFHDQKIFFSQNKALFRNQHQK